MVVSHRYEHSSEGLKTVVYCKGNESHLGECQPQLYEYTTAARDVFLSCNNTGMQMSFTNEYKIV